MKKLQTLVGWLGLPISIVLLIVLYLLFDVRSAWWLVIIPIASVMSNICLLRSESQPIAVDEDFFFPINDEKSYSDIDWQQSWSNAPIEETS